MRVGREVKRQVEASELQRRKAQMVQMSDEDRKKLYDSLMTLPKDRRIPALRSAGLDKEADELEHQMAVEHLEQLRIQKFEEINKLPVEEREAALFANGFLVETSSDVIVDEAVEPEVKKETPKKKGGRPKKQKK